MSGAEPALDGAQSASSERRQTLSTPGAPSPSGWRLISSLSSAGLSWDCRHRPNRRSSSAHTHIPSRDSGYRELGRRADVVPLGADPCVDYDQEELMVIVEGKGRRGLDGSLRRRIIPAFRRRGGVSQSLRCRIARAAVDPDQLWAVRQRARGQVPEARIIQPGLFVTDSIGISSRKMIKRAIRTRFHPMLPCERLLSVESNLICSRRASYRQDIWSRCVRLSCSASSLCVDPKKDMQCSTRVDRGIVQSNVSCYKQSKVSRGDGALDAAVLIVLHGMESV